MYHIPKYELVITLQYVLRILHVSGDAIGRSVLVRLQNGLGIPGSHLHRDSVN